MEKGFQLNSEQLFPSHRLHEIEYENKVRLVLDQRKRWILKQTGLEIYAHRQDLIPYNELLMGVIDVEGWLPARQ